jgi:hypothetical protein
VRWPPLLEHLSLSGSVSGQFLWDMLRNQANFPPSLHSVVVAHCPGLDHKGIRPLLCNLAEQLTTVELRDLPAVKHGRFNSVLDWLPHLTTLSVALDYIDTRFGNMPDDFGPRNWEMAKPLQSLTLVSSGQTSIDPNRSFVAEDLYALIDNRFLGRLRWVKIAASTEWMKVSDGADIGALEMLVNEVDEENWRERRWHYADISLVEGDKKEDYERWIEGTRMGRRMRPSLRMLPNR